MSCFFSANLSFISGVNHGTEDTERIVFDWIFLFAESGIKDVIKLRFS